MLESNITHHLQQLIDIGNNFEAKWNIPVFSDKIALNRTALEKFRYSQTFMHNYYVTREPFAVWNEAPLEISPNPSLLYLAHADQAILDMDIVDCLDTVFILVKDKDQYFVAKLPGFHFDKQTGIGS